MLRMLLVRMEDIEVKLIFWEEFLHREKYTWLWDFFWFGLVYNWYGLIQPAY